MHFEILVEDQSGKTALDILVPKILGSDHTYRVHPYKGIGNIPKDINKETDPKKRILLERLPQLLRGYGEAFSKYPEDYLAAVVIVCDLDKRCQKTFRQELLAVLDACTPQPIARFCIAVEEGEAWLLGDKSAVIKAYPRAKVIVINNYTFDSICDTWERLADAVYPGGSQKLKAQGWQTIGAEKSTWAMKIAPHIDVDKNQSPSFGYFLSKIRELAKSRPSSPTPKTASPTR